MHLSCSQREAQIAQASQFESPAEARTRVPDRDRPRKQSRIQKGKDMRRLLTVAVLVLGTVLAGAGELRAQTRADTAAILLNAARELRARGDVAAAGALLDYIQSQYS